MITIDQVIKDLQQFGHHHAAIHVRNSVSRLSAREANGNVVPHHASAKAADDAEGQVESQSQRVAVSGVR